MEKLMDDSEKNSFKMDRFREHSEEKLDKICDILDKLTLDTLFLMEKEIGLKMNVESSMSNGESHLAKTRYIMGQNSVSSLQLPSENTSEFTASLKVHSENIEVMKSKSYDLITVKNSEEDNVVNPLRWFGLLVPQNLNHAQTMFRQALQWTVQAVNVQSQLIDNINLICGLKHLKCQYKDEIVITE